MSQSTAAKSLSTTGATAATGIAVLGKDDGDTSVLCVISGTFGTVTLKFMGTLDGTNYFPVQAIDLSNGNVVNGTLSTTDNTTQAWQIIAAGYLNVEVYIVAIASGAVVVNGQSGHYTSPVASFQQTGAVVGGAQTMTGDLTLSDVNLVFGTTTGTKIGTATTQKFGFWNATPVVQIANTVDYVTMLTTLGLRASGGTAAATFPGFVTGLSFLASSPTSGGVGYKTGAGGTVTQITSITTGVTLDKLTGTITTFSAALATGVDASFTLTNSTIAATDIVVASIKSYGGTSDGIPVVAVQATGAGSCILNLMNNGAVTLDAPVVINYAVFKGVAT